ncbi:MAG TPA: DUF1080 domain-containing protein [Candidatus Sulfopaludibacter sp.]|jgi:hypothetical protein|nr:DUF1080 domain-containing protein [Candidatus Sulfopaludibacter sp.]
MLKLHRRSFLAGAIAAAARAQQTYVPKQSDRPEELSGDEPGFTPIFDGKTLSGWEGDPKYWRVTDGIMTGEITPETLIKSNTFLIWRGGAPRDFELKVDYRITTGGNSGINYRSVVVPDSVTPANQFAMRGYQCDIDGQNRYTGNNYEEKGRLFLAVRGQVTRVTGARTPVVVSTLGDNKELSALLTADWNSIHLTVRGNVLMHSINGRVMSVTIDDDPAGRKMEGLLGVQVHVGGPMKIEYRNWRIKNL